ncbi:hypothetical protein EIN_178550, partial [Entamoeba invadens IP1]|uniref:hypothetical protein n=1 Tax=Entamoeba invadens IP1 TaxID=370355 RepID=UPI0002C3D6BA
KNEDLHKTVVNDLHQAYRFVCVDETQGFCKKEETYYLVSMNADEKKPLNHYYVATFARYVGTVYVEDFSLPALPTSMIGMIFTPSEEDIVKLTDSEQFCGHYMFPYCILDKHLPFWGGYVGSHFEIQWKDQSYAKNKANYPQFDYSFLEDSTFVQNLESLDMNAGVPFLNERI